MSRFGFSPAVKKDEPVVAVPVAAAAPAARAKPEPAGFDMLEAKLRVHAKLIDELDLSALDKLDDETMRRRVRGKALAVVRPGSTAEVAAVVKASQRPSCKVITRGSSSQNPTPPNSMMTRHSASEYQRPRRMMCRRR